MRSINPITLTDKNTGKKFTLEFDKASVKFAEANGFNINAVGDKPMSGIEELFFYSFRMHHKKEVTREYTDRMLDALRPYPDGFVARLASLYAAPFDGEDEDPFVTIEM